jgi:3-hydroxyisobutyrate dehydrogenase-like beta-hydroxyacid dehydrogenase
MAVYWQGLCEALTMGVQAGLDLRQMLELIADSPACLGALPAKIEAILDPPDDVSFDITGVRKDVLAMIATGQLLGVPMPAGSATLISFAAATGADWGKRDLAELIQYYISMVQSAST